MTESPPVVDRIVADWPTALNRSLPPRESDLPVSTAGQEPMQRKPTVALFIPSIALGGAERQALQLAQYLNEKKWRVLLLTIAPAPHVPDQMSHVIHLSLGGRKGVSAVRRLASILSRERVEILQAFLLGAQIYALSAKAFSGDVQLVAAVRASMRLNQIPGWKGRISHALVFGFPALVAQYVFNSSAAERTVGGNLPAHKRRVISNGIDTARFRPDLGAREYLREIAGVPADGRIVGIIANVNAEKGYETFVRASAMVAREIPDVYFVALGEYRHPLGKRIQALVGEHSLSPKFRFIGSRKDVEKIIPGIDVVCSASSTEGFSNSIAEAMACGVPCVVTAVGDSALIVGEAGVIVPPNDAHALAAGLHSLLIRERDDLRALGAEARRRIEENFGIRRMVEQYEILYESLLGSSQGEKAPLHID